MSDLKPTPLDDDSTLSNQDAAISEDDENENLSDMESVTGSERDAVSETGSETPSVSDKSSQRLSRSASNTPTNTRSTRSQNNPKFVAKQKSFMAKVQAATSGAEVGMGRPETPGKRKRETSAPSTPPTKKRRSGRTDNNGQDFQNDNYCWECHREGVFICCEMCPRVFHLKCAGMEKEPEEDWACSECHAVMQAENTENRSRSMQLISVEQLCTLLKYALNRLQTMPGMEPFTKPVDVTEFPTYEDIVVHPVDFTSLERNIKRKFYGSTEAFSSDARWIVHNSVIFNGANSKVSSMARTLVKILKQEMSEIETCPDCYMNAHQNPRTWFTEVCRSAHPLIWARLKGFPFWPAKAVKWKDGNVDVRFFGRHDRSWVPIKECFLFSEQMPTPLKNRNKTLESCLQEVNEHIYKLREKFGMFKYAPHRVQFNPSDSEQIKIMLPNYKRPVPFRVRPHSRALSRLSAHSDDETSSIASTDSGAGHRRRRRESGTSSATQGTETETEMPARDSDIADTDRTQLESVTNTDCPGTLEKRVKERSSDDEDDDDKKMRMELKINDEDLDEEEIEDCGKYPGQVNSDEEEEEEEHLEDPDNLSSLMNGKSSELRRMEENDDTSDNGKTNAEDETTMEDKVEEKEKEEEEELESQGQNEEDTDKGDGGDEIVEKEREDQGKEGNVNPSSPAMEGEEEGSATPEEEGVEEEEEEEEEEVEEKEEVEKKQEEQKQVEEKEEEKKSCVEMSTEDDDDLGTLALSTEEEEQHREESEPIRAMKRLLDMTEEEEEEERKSRNGPSKDPNSTSDSYILADKDNVLSLEQHPPSTNKSESESVQFKDVENNKSDTGSDNISESLVGDTKDSITDNNGSVGGGGGEDKEQNETKLADTNISNEDDDDKMNEDEGSDSEKMPEIGFKTQDTDNEGESGSENETINSILDLQRRSELIDMRNIKNNETELESNERKSMTNSIDDKESSNLGELGKQCKIEAESENEDDSQETEKEMDLNKMLAAEETENIRSSRSQRENETEEDDGEHRNKDDKERKKDSEDEKESEAMNVEIKKENIDEKDQEEEEESDVLGRKNIRDEEDSNSLDNQREETNRNSLFDAVQLMKTMGTIAITRLDGKSLSEGSGNDSITLSRANKDQQRTDEDEDRRRDSEDSNKTGTSSQRHSPTAKLTENKDMEQHISSLGCSVSVTKAVEKDKDKDKIKEKEKVKMPSGVDTTRLSPSISIIPMSGGSDRHKMKTTIAPSTPGGSPAHHTGDHSASSHDIISSMAPASGTRVSSSSSSPHTMSGTIPPPPPLSHPQGPPASVGSRGVFGPPPACSQVVGMGVGRGPIMATPGMRMMSGSGPGMMVPPRVTAGPPPRHLPPEAGPLSAQLHKHSQKLAEVMRATLEDVLGGLVMTGTPEARVAALQLELERTNWRHQQELAEVRHNADVMLVEMRANLEAEKQRAIEEVKRQTEQQMIEARRQMERQMVERLSEVRRQMEAEKQRAVEETKRKQWCANCGKEALFFCCWNTSYCDYPCQQSHWPQHMSVCGQNSDGGGGEGGGTDSVNGEASAHSSRVSTPVQNLVTGQFVEDDGTLALAEEHRRRKLREDDAESLTSSILAQCLIKGNRDRPKKKSKSSSKNSGSAKEKEKDISAAPVSSPRHPNKSPKAWMDWFLEQSGAEGIKENLQVTPKCSKAKARKSNDKQPDGTRKKRKSTPCVRRKLEHILKPEEVTEEMLEKVATKPKEKTHDQENGTSCHQCRQKTADTKTICRSGRCVGLRGFFCGPCLRTRYGEDARKALLDPDWCCPVCRGVCNCSLCRKAFGQQAVGQIVQRLGKMGYSSVQQYLDAKGMKEEKKETEKETKDDKKEENDNQEVDESLDVKMDFQEEEEMVVDT
ncbi:hypothetical protein Pmani_017564 [Petrolisthes manimaculis]|uniref:Protein kinase C-binding protein 1-like n=1 Tax=Petrolisthes manimaculis TaxID=1843537 RepID=A0AAE1U9Q5_9EUCA|nr:hypothetical protein Pmani_017564 [Petrolisthes manimaculis]